MKCIYISLLICLSSLGIYAQNETPSNSLQIAYGQSYNLKLDETYSRLAKKGFNHFFNLEYTKTTSNNNIINADISFILGKLKTKGNSNNIIKDYNGNIKFKYLSKIPNSSIYLGGNVNFRGDLWFPRNSELRYGWDINLGIGFSALLNCNINSKIRIKNYLDVSLIGTLWRSHNNGQQLTTEETQFENGSLSSLFETPRFSHLLNTAYIDNLFKILYAFSDRIDLQYNFITSYTHIKKPLLKKGYEFSSTIGVAYKF